MPPAPLESFLVFKLLEINSAEKKLRLKNDENCCPVPEKNSDYAPDMKQF